MSLQDRKRIRTNKMSQKKSKRTRAEGTKTGRAQCEPRAAAATANQQTIIMDLTGERPICTPVESPIMIVFNEAVEDIHAGCYFIDWNAAWKFITLVRDYYQGDILSAIDLDSGRMYFSGNDLFKNNLLACSGDKYFKFVQSSVIEEIAGRADQMRPTLIMTKVLSLYIDVLDACARSTGNKGITTLHDQLNNILRKGYEEAVSMSSEAIESRICEANRVLLQNRAYFGETVN
jgi:hypothetical protein